MTTIFLFFFFYHILRDITEISLGLSACWIDARQCVVRVDAPKGMAQWWSKCINLLAKYFSIPLVFFKERKICWWERPHRAVRRAGPSPHRPMRRAELSPHRPVRRATPSPHRQVWRAGPTLHRPVRRAGPTPHRPVSRAGPSPHRPVRRAGTSFSLNTADVIKINIIDWPVTTIIKQTQTSPCWYWDLMADSHNAVVADES